MIILIKTTVMKKFIFPLTLSAIGLMGFTMAANASETETLNTQTSTAEMRLEVATHSSTLDKGRKSKKKRSHKRNGHKCEAFTK